MSVEEHLAGALLEEIGSDEDDIRRGKVMHVKSSNVDWFKYDESSQTMTIGFLDGSIYEYYSVPLNVALGMYRTGSPGGYVWDTFRVRGTVFGYKFEYALLDGPSKAKRVWHEAGPKSRRRHGLIPKSGEPFKGYHPAFAHQVGGMGKKRGSGAKKPSRRRKP
jgi:hypothetical protein